LPAHHLDVVNGVVVTSIARTLMDIARATSLSAGVVPIDAALHDGLVSTDELWACARDCWNWPGIRRAQRALRYADGRAESPLESVSRLVITWLRLPEPEPQVSITDGLGRLVGRVDFLWRRQGVVGEADGLGKYADHDVLVAEKRRQEALEDLGLVVVRWGWLDLQRPQLLRSRVQAAFERSARLDGSGLPPSWPVSAA
jgi:hypothetical protein